MTEDLFHVQIGRRILSNWEYQLFDYTIDILQLVCYAYLMEWLAVINLSNLANRSDMR